VVRGERDHGDGEHVGEVRREGELAEAGAEHVLRVTDERGDASGVGGGRQRE
jgi:hypothetical protein